MKQDSIEILKCLADKSRLKIMNNLMEAPMYVELLAERLDLTPPTVSFHLKKLEKAGLVYSTKEQYYIIYKANTELLNIPLLDLIHEEFCTIRRDMVSEKIFTRVEGKYTLC